mgnify:CR=1 FL=1
MNSIKVLKKIREIKAKILVKRYDFKVMQGMYWEKKILREPETRKKPKHVPNYRGSMHISVCVSKKAWLGAKIYPYCWAGL